MKNFRQNAIVDIITNSDIETQNQLIEALNAMGITSTQATVSRDIKELHIIKELSGEGRYRYAVAQKKDSQNYSGKLRAIFRECVINCVYAQNIIVVHTLPGMAQAACSAIDAMNLESIAGTIGGDDTCFICMFSTEEARKLCEDIKETL